MEIILMADIIDSSGKEGAALMDTFSNMVQEVNHTFNDKIRSPLTITLGDEYQGIIFDLQTAREIIFFLDEKCLASHPYFRLRHVINRGTVDTEINPDNAHGMLGQGLTEARKLLNALKKEELEIMVRGFEPALCEKLDLAFRLYRAFYNDWPEKDREVALSFIQLKDYKTVAEKYDKDVSTMWRKEKTLKMKDFRAARKLVKKLMQDAAVMD